MRIPKYHVLATRWNGNVTKLYVTCHKILAEETRKLKLNKRKFQYIIITQGYTY